MCLLDWRSISWVVFLALKPGINENNLLGDSRYILLHMGETSLSKWSVRTWDFSWYSELWNRRSDFLKHSLHVHYYLCKPAPIEINFEGCSQSYKTDFPLTSCGRKTFWDNMADRDIINITLQTHIYNLDYMSTHWHQCSCSSDFLLLAVLHGGEDVIKIHKFISPTVNITFKLTLIKVINYNHNHHFKDRGSETEKVNGISLKLY